MHDESIEEENKNPQREINQYARKQVYIYIYIIIYIYTCTSIQFYYWVKLYSYVDIYMPGLYFNTFQVHVFFVFLVFWINKHLQL